MNPKNKGGDIRGWKEVEWDDQQPSTIRGVTHEIKLKTGTKPYNRHYKESNIEKQRAMEEEVDSMLRNEIIEEMQRLRKSCWKKSSRD